MFKTVLSLSLVVNALMSSAFADGNLLVTSCSGQDNKGNAISLKILQDPSAKEYSSSNPSSITIELQTPDAPLSYVVLDENSESGDASLEISSEDNGGIKIKTEGGGVMTSGSIGILGSKFKFIDCRSGEAAPQRW